MHRLFVALRPPAVIRAALAQMMNGVPGARWQADAQLHLTLRFIGEVERPLAEEIALAISAVAAPAPVVSLAAVGQFDKRGRTDALWAGLTPHEALGALHRKVDHALVRLGLEPERRAYLPHITLARLPRSAGHGPALERWIADHATLSSAPFAMADLILYESSLGHAGASYVPIVRHPLVG
ncbi:MAG: RNA 2',3'-cyclic phosphodiesterase [Candidatus Sphingomonas colombiensis]|nr:RNA 2',3'-cyclic phosphodiesterase [Sphingomonas sp.]WEK43018.1 MAG: RNA 2',3'-cyclic phosphodiesterase [Sphingomonas sp.]